MFNPSNKLVVYCYAAVDFAGLWVQENHQDHICAGSRTTLVVTFSNCHLLWVSKIQTYISLYNLNYEYVTLYHYVRELLPLKSLIKYVINNLGIDSEKFNFVSISTVYEEYNLLLHYISSEGLPTA